jgi:hypothetical protein
MNGGKQHAFGLPQGTVRAIIALMLVAGLLYLAIGLQIKDAIVAVISLGSTAIGIYFHKKHDSNSKGE